MTLSPGRLETVLSGKKSPLGEKPTHCKQRKAHTPTKTQHSQRQQKRLTSLLWLLLQMEGGDHRGRKSLHWILPWSREKEHSPVDALTVTGIQESKGPARRRAWGLAESHTRTEAGPHEFINWAELHPGHDIYNNKWVSQLPQPTTVPLKNHGRKTNTSSSPPRNTKQNQT